MLKSLKKRFVMLAMAGMLLITLIVVGAINIINYVNVKSSIEGMVDLIGYNDGSVPGLQNKLILENLSEESDPDKLENSDTDKAPQPAEDLDGQADKGDEQNEKNQINSHQPSGKLKFNEESQKLIDKGKVAYDAESQYTTRFFSVTYASDGTILNTNVDNIATYTEEEAEQIASKIYSGKKAHGWDGHYYFDKIDKDGNTMIIYLDCSTETSNCKRLLIISSLVALGSLILEFIILILLSGKVVRPVAESIIKQKEFITDASHELKTPLTIISANAEVMEMMDGANEWTESIQKQTARMTKLVNDMVLLARMDEGGKEPIHEKFNLSEAVIDVALGFKTPAERKEVEFDCEFDEDLEIIGNEAAIRQLTSILLDNALKYVTEKGSIKLKLYRKGKHCVLEVYNTCDDLGDTDLSMLFERFYRIDKSRSRATGGSGIGLSVAKAIVDNDKSMHISAESEDRKSIVFKVIFKES
jgi:K+-sensing histidine kinase KdpD